jgi:hypothetical protein
MDEVSVWSDGLAQKHIVFTLFQVGSDAHQELPKRLHLFHAYFPGKQYGFMNYSAVKK